MTVNTFPTIGEERAILAPATPLLVTPSDTGAIVDARGETVIGRGFIVGTDGDISFETLYNGTVVIPEGTFVEGLLYPILFRRINSTGTTATGIVALY